MRSLYEEYLSGSSDALEFFAGAPRGLLDAPSTRAQWGPGFVDELRSYQKRLGGNARLDGNEIAIVTGQQPGLLVGPLYTIYKAVTAIILAQRLNARHGVAYVPVFWLAGDDHDFEEAHVTHILTKTNEPLRLAYEPQQDVTHFPMYRVPVEASLHDCIDRAADNAPGFEFREEVRKFLHDSLNEADSFADWSARILTRLFADTPLVIFAPHLPVARRLAKDIIERDIQEPLESTRLLNEAGRRLESKGFRAQVVKESNDCNFFLELERQRCKVIFRDGTFQLPEKGLAYSQEELLELLRTTPERFSGNVALRCIVQQRLFPAAAYVAGPGEIAYWAQLKPLFEHFGPRVPSDAVMPVVYPRARCTLTSLKLNKLLKKLGLSLHDLAEDEETLLERVLRASGGNKAFDMIRTRRNEIAAALRALVDQLRSETGEAAGMAESLERSMESQFDRMERLVLLRDETRTQTFRGQVQRLQNALMPWRKPQERVYTVFSFLFEHGWGLVPRLLNELDVESFEMNEVEL